MFEPLLAIKYTSNMYGYVQVTRSGTKCVVHFVCDLYGAVVARRTPRYNTRRSPAVETDGGAHCSELLRNREYGHTALNTRDHANCRAIAPGHPTHSRPGVHAGKIPIRSLSSGTDARLAVRHQKEQVPDKRRPAGGVLRAGGQATAFRMAGQYVSPNYYAPIYLSK